MPFREIAGHRHLIGRLSLAISRGTLPPSLIFAGPAGVGKRHTALAVAQALNCQTPLRGACPDRAAPTDAPLSIDGCGSCSTCDRIVRAVYPDVLQLAPGDTGNIAVEAVREVIDQSGYRPFEGRRRVVVIDDADTLVLAGQNALLKILEEPPSATMFVLVTVRPDALLPTVRSRCPRLRFGPLSVTEIASVLTARGCAEPEARAAAASAGGSLEAALRSETSERTAARAAAHEALGGLEPRATPADRLQVAKLLAGQGTDRTGASARDDLGLTLRCMASLLRDLSLLDERAGSALVANSDLAAELETLGAAYRNQRALRAFGAVQRALGALERNASPKIVADWLVFQF